MSGYFNEAGEPLMDAAAMRFEAELDAQSASEAMEDRWLDDDGFYDEDGGDEDYEDEPDPIEDQWLDGYYED